MLKPIDMILQAEIEAECRKHQDALKPFHGFKASIGRSRRRHSCTLRRRGAGDHRRDTGRANSTGRGHRGNRVVPSGPRSNFT